MEEKKKNKKVTPRKANEKKVRKPEYKHTTKKKAFTLIELLAVIIILGILMIIAIPSVTSYINNSRKSAYVDTAKQIVSGARNKVNEGKLDMFSTDTTYYIPASYIETENASKSPYGEFTEAYVGVIYDGKGYKYYWISRDETGQGVKELTLIDNLDEDKIESDIASGEINTTIRNTGIGNGKTIKVLEKNETTGIWSFNVVKENAPTISEDGALKDVVIYPEGKDKSSVSVGEKVKIGNEEFYVLKHDGNSLVLLSHYNLNIGTNAKQGDTEGKQDIDVYSYASGHTTYGNIHFSNSNYWKDNVGDGKKYLGSYNGPDFPYVYDENSVLYQYVENYKSYLISIGANVKEARLAKYSELADLGCKTYSLGGCRGADVPGFIKETTYWIGNASYDYNVYFIRANDAFDSYVNQNTYPGLRPVIVI